MANGKWRLFIFVCFSFILSSLILLCLLFMCVVVSCFVLNCLFFFLFFSYKMRKMKTSAQSHLWHILSGICVWLQWIFRLLLICRWSLKSRDVIHYHRQMVYQKGTQICWWTRIEEKKKTKQKFQFKTLEHGQHPWYQQHLFTVHSLQLANVLSKQQTFYLFCFLSRHLFWIKIVK